MADRDSSPVRCIDTDQYGTARRGAAYLLVGRQIALVETGTPRAAARLRVALDGRRPSHLFVTHVHLDHAGSAGELAIGSPETIVVAHPRAIQHLADPSRLIEGVRAASPTLFPLYGTPTPVPSAQLYGADDGERFDLGDGRIVEAIHTPGHAPHHLCFLDNETGTLFTGDAVGNHAILVDVPLTVPPRFDLDASLATLDRLRRMRPNALAFTHFGIASEPPEALIDRYAQALPIWFDRIRRLRETREPEDVVRDILAAPKYVTLTPADRSSIEMCIRGALMTIEAEQA